MSQYSESEHARAEAAGRLLRQNRLDEARRIYESLCVPEQQDVDLWVNLALVYRKSGRFEQARIASEHALSINGDHALARHIYGSVQQCLGNLPAAITSYRQALELDPSLAEAYYFLGNALQMKGNPEGAAVSYQGAISLRPDYLEALSNLGAVLLSLHRFDDAQVVLQRANRLCPECEQILCNLGDLALTNDDLAGAERFARTAIGINPGFLDAHLLLGKVYRKKGDYDRVLEHYGNARAISPGNENILGGIAEILEIRGEFDEARRILTPLMKKGSANPLVLRVYSALSRHYGEEQGAIDMLEHTLQRGSLDLSQRVRLHSELGKQYDRLEQYPQAFRHYREANEIEKQLNAHIREKSRPGHPALSLINRWFTQYDAEYWRKLPRSGMSSERPVFVVGMPRSGTTLAEQILASHPEVYGAGELPELPELVQQLHTAKPGGGYIGLMEKLDPGELATAANKYLAASGERAGDVQRVVDKMPMNFWNLGIISVLFPDARVIHMKRDPRDVCLSIYFQRFDAGMTFTTDLEELAAYYAAYARIMDFWHTVLDIRILDVSYEDLVADQENMIRRMIGFCGLEWNDRCLEFYKSDRDVNTPSYDQVRQPMYSRSVGRWRHYRKQLAPLTEALGLDA